MDAACVNQSLLVPSPPPPQGMSDLMRENDDGVSVMQWLRSAYPADWDNLLERLKPQLGGLDPR